MPTFHFNGENTLTDAASIDCFNGKSKQYGQCVALVNVDIDDEGNASRRDGSTPVLPDVVTSGWSNGDKAYCVKTNRLHSFDGTALTIRDADLAVDAVCEFEEVNDVVVFSDDIIIGIIEQNGTVTRIDRPADWVGVENLEQWLADHAPADPAKWDGVTSNSNFEVDAYKLATLAGNCLHFFAGVLYLAIDNFVYATNAMDVEHMDIRYCVVAGFPGAVTMISHVDDGLFIGTTGGTYFLPGTGVVVSEKGDMVSAFNQRQVDKFPAIKGTAVRISADHLPALQTQGIVTLWATRQGIMAGVGGGGVVNLSADKVTLPDVASGCACFRETAGVRQYLVSLGDEVRVLNTYTLAPSRYLGYQFDSLFVLAGSTYGTPATGIYRLTGERDGHRNNAYVDAYILTPVTNFGSRMVAFLEALYLNARCEGDMAVDYYVNEQLRYEDDTIGFNDDANARERRARPPRGLRGNYWQFKLRNVDGTRFTAFGLEPVVAKSKNRTS